MDKIIKECINDYLKNKLIMEYSAKGNKVIYNDIMMLSSLLEKVKSEILTDIDVRHNKGEMVSRNEAIVKKTVNDIDNLIGDLKFFVK